MRGDSPRSRYLRQIPPLVGGGASMSTVQSGDFLADWIEGRPSGQGQALPRLNNCQFINGRGMPDGASKPGLQGQ